MFSGLKQPLFLRILLIVDEKRNWQTTARNVMKPIETLQQLGYLTIINCCNCQNFWRHLLMRPGWWIWFTLRRRWYWRGATQCHLGIWDSSSQSTMVWEDFWVAVSNIFYFHPYLGKWSNLTNIFQMGWNHQLDFEGLGFSGSFRGLQWRSARLLLAMGEGEV